MLLIGSYLLKDKREYIPVFRLTENPAVITRGMQGSLMTVNVSFGDEKIKEWIESLEQPYPLFFVDLKWAERFPETIETMRRLNITIGLLGSTGVDYQKNDTLLKEQILQYEKIFGIQPLWFRTTDEHFPKSLQEQLWTYEINALGSSMKWPKEEKTAHKKGEIIAATSSVEQSLNTTKLTTYMRSHEFHTIEEVLFGQLGKSKKIPQ